MAPPVTDLALARRLERAEGSANVAFVESRAARMPESGATWCDVAGTYAMFDGVGSPLTQTFGLGLFSAPTVDDLGALESFFESRGAGIFHEVSPLAALELLPMLPARGYHPVEMTTVMHLPLARGRVPAGRTTQAAIRRVDAGELPSWADASAAGWGESPELAAFVRSFGLIMGSARGVSCFVAELDGMIAGTGAMAVHDGVALLAGASTIPASRGRGVQSALLGARLEFAAAHGCDLAMMGAAPGSTSQTNAERQGFRIAYTRTKWHLSRI
ncbi:MAG: GNAT family N-acetyltransferase [Gemmatimonadaceae bacterium]